MTKLDLNQSAAIREVVRFRQALFRKRADAYVCAGCGRDITRHFHRGQAHVWQAVGPQGYVCRCGRRWLTGAVEWDHLSDWDRRGRIRGLVGLSILFTAAFAVPGLLVDLVLRRWRAAPIAGLAVAFLPAALLCAAFWLEVGASIWRTRTGWKG